MVMGTLIAWVLVRDKLPGRDGPRHPDRPAVRAAHHRRRPRAAHGLRHRTARSGSTSPTRAPVSSSRCCSSPCRSSCAPCSPCCSSSTARWSRPRRRSAPARRRSSCGSSCRTSCPAMAAGTALAFARAMSEFGSTVLISGNLPFKTQVASVHIFNQIESDNVTGAAAVVDRAAARVAGRAGGPRPAAALGGPSWLARPQTVALRRTGVRLLLRTLVLVYLTFLLVIPVGLVLWQTFENGIGAGHRQPDHRRRAARVPDHRRRGVLRGRRQHHLRRDGALILLVRHEFRGKRVAQRADRPAARRVSRWSSAWRWCWSTAG